MISQDLEQERGMLDLDKGDGHSSGIARCCAADCGWEGFPVYVGGEAQTWCPRCEGFGDEPDLREHPLRYDIHLRQRPQHQHVAKQGRNDPCRCGSGLKAKRCCDK